MGERNPKRLYKEPKVELSVWLKETTLEAVESWRGGITRSHAIESLVLAGLQASSSQPQAPVKEII